MSFPQGAVGDANRVAIQTVASLVSERQKTGYALRGLEAGTGLIPVVS